VGEKKKLHVDNTPPGQAILPPLKRGIFMLYYTHMIAYKIRKSAKAKRVSIKIDQNRQVTLTIPARFPQYLAKQFIVQKQAWIEEKLATIPDNIYTQEHYKHHKEKARDIITARVQDCAQIMGLSYNRLSIRHTTTRWGSCSSKRNLNFSYKLIFLDSELMDYVIIHELAHLVEMNHSKRFWNIVGTYCEDYLELRARLRNC
jgi:predicted metal-dependent hydrolase